LLTFVEAALDAFAAEVRQMPKAYVFFLLAMNLHLDPPKQIVIAGSRSDHQAESMLEAAQRFYMPEITLLFRDTAMSDEDAELFTSLSGKDPVSGQAVAYICDDAKCRIPIMNLEQFTNVVAEFVCNNVNDNNY
jgi:uncharacterized protein YyaL (SSP411 family)